MFRSFSLLNLAILLGLSNPAFARVYDYAELFMDRQVNRTAKAEKVVPSAPQVEERAPIENQVNFNPGPAPRNGWRGELYSHEGQVYFLWSWSPDAPWWSWPMHQGWKLGMNWYFPDGLKCYADHPEVGGEWVSDSVQFASDDAINSALRACETDKWVEAENAARGCRIKTCVPW